MEFIKDYMNSRNEPLIEFDDELFAPLVDRVMIISPSEFVFVFENGMEKKVKGK